MFGCANVSLGKIRVVQQRLLDDLVAAGVDAVAVSVVDPATSTDAINRVAAQIPYFAFDSDAPQSNRIAYFGSSNVELGKNAGELMKKAMEGKTGKCIGFVGLPGAANAKERIDGYNEAVKGTGLELIDVRGDDIDQTRARANVDDVLVANLDQSLERRAPAEDAAEVLQAFPDGLTTAEVALVMTQDKYSPDLNKAEDSLIAAIEQDAASRLPFGHDALWVPSAPVALAQAA